MKVGKVLEFPCKKLLPINFSNFLIKKKVEDFLVAPPPHKIATPQGLNIRNKNVFP
jgi:hypothetical protein